MTHTWIDIEYEGFTFRVEGEWEEATKGNDSEPGEPAGFNEYKIYIPDLNRIDITNTKFVLPEVIDKIVEMAEGKIRGMV